MNEEQNNNLPKSIEDLLKLSRSNIEKLIAAWDGLSVETQIQVFTTINERIANYEFRGTPNFSYLHTKLFQKGLESSNDYVRYLSVRYLTNALKNRDEEGFNKLNEKVNKDESDLVRSAQFEHFFEFDIADGFFDKQTHQERLARVRSGHLNGDLLAEELTKAIENNYFSDADKEIELLELLDEYLSNDENNENYYVKDYHYIDGFRDHSITKELKALWNVVPKLPGLAGELMVQKLPHNAPMGNELFKSINKDLTNEQLSCLLVRKDIVATDFRKEVFWRDEIPSEDKYAPFTQFWAQASNHHFRLDEEEFAKILSLPVKEQEKRLGSISQADSLQLYQYEVIIQLLTKFNKKNNDAYSSDYEIDFARYSLKGRLNQEADYFREEQLIKLRLYDQAYKSRNWRRLDSDDYHFKEVLYPVKVEGDVWKTFLAFLDAIKKSKLTLKDLPKTEYEEWEEEEEEIPLEKPLASELSQLNSLISTTRDAAFQNRLALAVIAGLVLISVIF